MSLQTFATTLASSLDVAGLNKFLLDNRKITEAVLKALRPEGLIAGNRFQLASIGGGAGKSFDFNLENHNWGDHAKSDYHSGLIGFITATLQCSAAQAISWLGDKKYIDPKLVKKKLQADEGDPLVLPIPDQFQPWDYVTQQSFINKDRALIKERNLWTYKDIDGSLLGYKYRIDDRRNTKEIFTLTYRAQSGWVKKEWDKKNLPPYGLDKLGRGPNVRILFVEGEPAADKAQEIFGDRWKVLSFSGVRASNALWLPEGDFWEEAEVVIWPDNDAAGREAARKIQLRLEAMKHKPKAIRIVRVETFTSLPPKWDLGDWEEGCGVDPQLEIQRAEEIDSFERVCREWVFCSQTDSFYNLTDRQLIWTSGAFDRTYARYKDKNTPSQKFLADQTNRIVADLDFVPGAPQIIFGTNGKYYLNEWFDTPAYAEAKQIAADTNVSDEEIAENARYFIEHVHRICGKEMAEPEYDVVTGDMIPGTQNRPLFDAFMWHFSQIIQRPMDKRGWVIMLVSEQNGTGKTYFVRMVGSILGYSRTASISVNQYIGDYHDWADGVLFYELGEAKRQDSTDVYEELKKRHSYLPFNENMLADRTNNTEKLNIKTKAQKSQRDYKNGMITANDLYPIALANTSGLESSDRRLLVINPTMVLNDTQNHNLFDIELATRPQWIGAYLMRYQPEFKWNPSWAPITAHKRLMLEKDRTRSENRTQRYELGKHDEFFHLMRYAMEEKVGAMGKKVWAGSIMREIAKHHNVKYPYDTVKFDKLMLKAGIHKGPALRIDGELRQLYTSDEAMLLKKPEEWKEEFKRPHNTKDA